MVTLYPASGQRNQTSGTFGSVGTTAWYWSNSCSVTTSWGLYLLYSDVYPSGGAPHACGFVVRCVQNLLLLNESSLT